MTDLDKIKDLRARTGLGMHAIKKALDEAGNDEKKAIEILKEQGLSTVAKKADRAANQGMIYTYTHPNFRFGSMIEVNCETDFVARGDDFKEFVHNVALYIAAMNPENLEELLKGEHFKHPGQSIQDLLNALIAKLGENIKIRRFCRFELGEEI